MAAKPKLTYFDFRGAAEPIRYVLEYSNVEYEDKRIQVEDWLELKPTIPFGLLPTLEINGKVINQSTAICRYYAKKVGLAGSDDFEALQIDAIADTVVDLRTAIGMYHWRTPEAEKPARAKVLKTENIPTYFSQFEKILKENDGYFVNGKLSYADLLFAGTAEYFNNVMKFDVFEGYPLAKALVEKVHNLPRIKEWVARRPQTLL
ncbi:hypothetical protein R5R35_005247 [Gryllus longicercus]|uniref:glutathione transferase n=1 Tax=Gryllus longicercus TaxID=2509291 RepID=A0AAN9VKW3_9ORTH